MSLEQAKQDARRVVARLEVSRSRASEARAILEQITDDLPRLSVVGRMDAAAKCAAAVRNIEGAFRIMWDALDDVDEVEEA